MFHLWSTSHRAVELLFLSQPALTGMMRSNGKLLLVLPHDPKARVAACLCAKDKIYGQAHTLLWVNTTPFRDQLCGWEHRFVFPSGKKAYINICLVTGTHWPQDLKLLLWKLLKLLSFDITGFQPVLTDFQTVPFCGAYAPAVDLCLDKTLVSSSTSCRQGSGQTQGFAFSIRLPQRFRAC